MLIDSCKGVFKVHYIIQDVWEEGEIYFKEYTLKLNANDIFFYLI